MLGRARRKRDPGGHATENEGGGREVIEEQPAETAATDESATAPERPPEAVRDQLERLTAQILGLQQQVEQFVVRGSDAVSEQVNERVAGIVEAAKRSAAEITAKAQREAATLREHHHAQALAEANRIRVEAQVEAAKTRTEAHADAVRLREEALAEIRGAVDRLCARLLEDIQACANEVLDAVARRSPAPPSPAGADPVPDERESKLEEQMTPGVEEAVDELQSAAAVLEHSLQHLHEIGEGLPEASQ